MNLGIVSIERVIEDALVGFLRDSLPESIGLAHFEDLVADAEPPLVVVKAERQQEISWGTGVWEVDLTIISRNVRDQDWAKIEKRLLDTAALTAALNTDHMATVDGQAVDYDQPTEREVDEEHQREFPIKIFAALLNQT